MPRLTKQLFILGFYYLSTVFLHRFFGRNLFSVFETSTREEYDLWMLAVAIITLVIFSSVTLFSQKINQSKITLIWCAINLILSMACYYYLFVLNSEAAHFIQYGIVAILLFSLTKNYLDTFVIGVLLGAIDELYQYLYLNPTAVAYYDFNDIIIDAVGIGWGLIFISSQAQVSKKTDFAKFKSSLSLKIIFGALIIIIPGLISGAISYDPNDKAILQITKANYSPDYWIHLKHQVVYHIIRPYEALAILISLGVLYLQLENYE